VLTQGTHWPDRLLVLSPLSTPSAQRCILIHTFCEPFCVHAKPPPSASVTNQQKIKVLVGSMRRTASQNLSAYLASRVVIADTIKSSLSLQMRDGAYVSPAARPHAFYHYPVGRGRTFHKGWLLACCSSI